MSLQPASLNAPRRPGTRLLPCVVLGLLSASTQGQGLKLNAPLADAPGAGGQVTGMLEVTPDSTRLVYVADQDGDDIDRLFVTPIDGSGDPIPLVPSIVDGGDVTAFEITQDGSAVLYLADQITDGTFELFAVALDGVSPPLRLNQNPVPGGDVTEFAVSPDGSRAFYFADEETDGTFHWYSVATDAGSSPVRLTAAPLDFPETLVITPDSASVLFIADDDDNGLREIRRSPVDGSQPSVELAATTTDSFELSPDGQWALYLEDDLFSVAVAGGSPPVVLNDPVVNGGRVFEFTTHPDSSLVLYRAGGCPSGQAELFRVPIDRSASPTRLHAPFTIFNQTVDAFALTPAGDRVVFRGRLSLVMAPLDLFVVPLDASAAPLQLSTPATTSSNVEIFGVSPDSARAVYTVREGAGARELLSVPLDAGEPPTQISSDFPDAFGARFEFAAASRLIFEADQDQPLVAELYSVPIDGSQSATKLHPDLDADRVLGPWKVAPSGTDVVFRSDLDEVDTFEVYGVALALPGIPVKLNGPLTPGASVGSVADFRMAGDEPTFVYRADGDTATVLELYSITFETRKRAVRLNGPLSGGSVQSDWVISPDASRVVYVAFQDTFGVSELYSAPVDGSLASVKLNGPLVSGGNVGNTFSVGEQVFFSGRRFLAAGGRAVYLADQEESQTYELFSAPLDGSAAPVKLNGLLPVDGDVHADFVASSDGTHIVYRADQEVDNVHELFAAPIDGSAPPMKISGPLQSSGDVRTSIGSAGPPFSVSPDGAWVVYTADAEVDQQVELYSVPIDASLPAVKISGASVNASNIFNDAGPAFEISSDSTRVVYSADQDIDSTFELFTAPIDGSAPAVKVHPDFTPQMDVEDSFGFSPDGEYVVYIADELVDNRFELFSAPAAGGGPSIRLNAAVGPFGSVGISGRDGAFHITPDSRRVVFFAPGNNSLSIYSVPIDRSEEPIQLHQSSVSVSLDDVFLTGDSRHVFFLRKNVYVASIGTPLSARRLNPLLQAGESIQGFQVTPGGQSVAYRASLNGSGGSELYLSFVPSPHVRAPRPPASGGTTRIGR
ncbi:MAG: hypothetical protein CMJ89_01715 [Planctomycetes bacterium]|jgi:Tol biopolymer transport system component|nr:hypothetical protein [Planctomycetota bacterium]